MTPLQRIVARVLALGSAYFAVSLLERMAASAEADAAAARLAAHAADAALFEHLTGDGCAASTATGDELLSAMYRDPAHPLRRAVDEARAAAEGGGGE